MCDIVWISPQSHSSLSVKPHFWWHALHWSCTVRKRFSSDHWRLWRSKPGNRIVGSTTKVELTTVANCQSSLHRLVTSIVCKSLHSGLRDSRRSGGWKTSSYTISPVTPANKHTHTVLSTTVSYSLHKIHLSVKLLRLRLQSVFVQQPFSRDNFTLGHVPQRSLKRNLWELLEQDVLQAGCSYCHKSILETNALPVTQSTVSKHWRCSCHHVHRNQK